MPSPVLVVGSFNQDLTWNTARLPAPGETTVGTFTTGPGGKGSNQAVASARTGVVTAFVGAIGDDTFGQALPAFYDSEGIHHHLAIKPELPTGNAGIWVDGTGQNEIIVALGSNLALCPDDLPAALLDDASVVLCQHEIDPAMTAWTLREAHQRGKTAILNPAPMIADFDPAILEFVSILAPNETEFTELLRMTGQDTGIALEQLDQSALHRLCRSLGALTVIITLGERGCFISQPDSHELVPPVSDVKVLDTTGAGDAFVGGLASGLVQFDRDLSRAARYANTVAALSVTRPGTAPSMPRRAEIAALFEKAL